MDINKIDQTIAEIISEYESALNIYKKHLIRKCKDLGMSERETVIEIQNNVLIKMIVEKITESQGLLTTTTMLSRSEQHERIR